MPWRRAVTQRGRRSDVTLTQLHEGNGGNDSLSFDYQKVALVTQAVNANGSLTPAANFSFDVATNQMIDPGTLPAPVLANADGPYSAIEDATLIVSAANGVLANDFLAGLGAGPASTAASKYFLVIDGLNGGSVRCPACWVVRYQ
jgi:hypothetical protein